MARKLTAWLSIGSTYSYLTAMRIKEVVKEEVKPEAKEAEKTAATQPKVSSKTKLIATGEVKAAQSKMLLGNIKRQLNGIAKKQGFDGVRDVKIAKQNCSGGTCTGIGQGTAFKTVITFEAGNAVAVTQDDKSQKNAVIKNVTDGKYVVTYEDNPEATVEKSKLSIQKANK